MKLNVCQNNKTHPNVLGDNPAFNRRINLSMHLSNGQKFCPHNPTNEFQQNVCHSLMLLKKNGSISKYVS